MKIAIISPTYPPDHCGVGDHSARMAPALVALGHDVTVLTGQAVPQANRDFQHPFHIRYVEKPWSTCTLLGKLTPALQEGGFDRLIIQYTPNFYPAGSLLWIARLAARFSDITLIAHETHFPLYPDRNGITAGIPQWLRFRAIGAIAAIRGIRVLFSTEVNLRYWSKVLGDTRQSQRHLGWLAVGANIAPDNPELREHPTETSGTRALLQKTGVPERHIVLVQFGTLHASRAFDLSMAALIRIRQALGPDSVSLVLAGAAPNQVRELLQDAGHLELEKYVHGTGFLQTWEVAAWLRRADIVLAPFVDGISARRTSAMAAFAFGRTVLTTQGVNTDPSVPWDRFCASIAIHYPRRSIDPPREDELAAFGAQASALARDSATRTLLAQNAREYYEKNWTWNTLAQTLANSPASLKTERRESA